MATRPRRANSSVTVDWKKHYGEIWGMTTSTEPTHGMTLAQFLAARDALRGALAQFERVQPDCRSCKHFALGTCELHGDVPAEFQKTPEACQEWAWDSIPF